MEKGSDMSLLLGDTNHFKRFNNSYGHQVSDQILKLVGMILKETATGSAKAARYGGEEFAIVLPQATLSEAVELSETVRTTVTSKRIREKSTG